MNRLRFPFDSDQMELLIAFEESKGLGELAEKMCKDPSVVSRGLQKMAEQSPVLVKVKGRWELTPLGRQVNIASRDLVARLREILPAATTGRELESDLSKSVLLLINAQKGLLDATQAGRNNLEAEKNIQSLLTHWRTRGRRVIYVKHVSDNPASLFFRHADGSDFLPELAPQAGEEIVEKTKSSGFQETRLQEVLSSLGAESLLLVGFTANECIDATARDASAAGFSTLVAGDATAMFDLKDASGKLLKADRLHKLTLANLHAFHAKVIATREALS